MNDINTCPECGEGLKTYVNLIIPSENAYCPGCNVLKKSYMTVPYLCSNCHSVAFYEKNDEDTCWLCKGQEFQSLSVDEFYELENAGGLKKGFYESQKGRKGSSNCAHRELSDLERHLGDVFVSECSKCGDEIYINLPEHTQEREDWTNRSRISLEEFIKRDKSYEPELVPFKDEEDLKKKLLKKLEEGLE